MFITKRHLSRRAVLRGIGATVSLPLLDAMIPAGTALAQTAARPLPYMACIYIPHGAVAANWDPKETGTDYTMSPILKPLEPYRKYLTIVSGLRNKAAESPAPHAITPGTWLTAVHPPQSQQPDVGPSVEQVAARVLSRGLPLQSIELAGEGGGGASDPAFGASYSDTISFRTGTQPLPMIQDPRTVFTTLFGDGNTPQQRAAILRQSGSILDFVRESTQRLQQGLGAADQRRVADYLDSVREVERRIQGMEAKFGSGTGMKLPDAPQGIPDDYGKMLQTMFDMMKLAWQANMTRCATFMMAREVTMRTFPNLNISDAWHPLSHHHNDPDNLAKLTRIQHFMTASFAGFVKSLAETEDGDGTLLDHAIVLYGSDMANSDMHNHTPLPQVLLGHGCGTIKGGQHLAYPQDAVHANLLLTMLHRAGVPAKSHGDSTGVMAEI
ncbi:MAG TPA: DUF1552 domain-containing protein [Steroidobacteraceae bacterium]|nr:DUF1552 domain-containing protein [Steroidobacteraceae bacterium]